MSTTTAFTLCAVLAIVALPLALRLIGPNRFYGFRTRATLSDRELWYSANAFGGWALLVAAIVAVMLIELRPPWFDFGAFTNLAAFVLPSAVAVAASALYVRGR